MKLTIGEIKAIREEIARLGNVEHAIRFCLGYSRILCLSEDEWRTINWVKRQL